MRIGMRKVFQALDANQLSRLDQKKNHLGLVRAFIENSRLQEMANLAIVVRGLDNPLQQRDQLKGEERAILDEIARLLDEQCQPPNGAWWFYRLRSGQLWR